jgi:signal transduction histidine kinase
MQAIDRIWRTLSIDAVLTQIKVLAAAPESADYTAWRQKFFRDRLVLATWASLLWTLVQAMLLASFFYFHPNRLRFAEIVLICNSIAGLFVVANLLLQRTRLKHSHSEWLFLGLCWSLTGFAQVGRLIISQNSPEKHFDLNVGLFTLIFLTLAALIPVRWRLHAIAQLGVLGLHFILKTASGLGSEESGLEQVWAVLFQLWVCFICDLGVYLYEHLKRAEVESRRQLQAFVQSVSEDLRTPALSSLKELKELLKQPGERVAVLRSKLEGLLESSDRQFELVNSLLDKARSSTSLNRPQQNRIPAEPFTGIVAVGLKRIEKVGRAFGLKELAPSTVIQTNNSTIDYEVWRYQFTIERLRLVWWITFGCTVTLFIPEFFAAQVNPDKGYGLFTYALILLYLAAWSILYRSQFGRTRPALLFVSFACAIPLISQFFSAVVGVADPDMIVWTIVFLMMATLVPVGWRLHVASQIGVLIGYFCLNLAFGLDFYLNPLRWIWVGWYLFWIYGICDITVYTYEQLQQNEFDSRRQLRIFLHSVAHDLKTPVLGASLVLQNLLNHSGETLQVPRYVVERMVQGGDRQLHLINSLLEAHLSPTQGVVCQCEPTPLRAFTQTVMADVEPLLNRNQAVFANLVPADLPPVNADPLQLWRVFENLVTNALKYNPPGVKLTLQAIVEAGMVRCSVQDNGVGISPDLCKQIFDLYSRGAHVRRSPGLGLGLYLCQQIITAHGGKIGVISSPGAGSTFWFTLPLASPPTSKRSTAYTSSL